MTIKTTVNFIYTHQIRWYEEQIKSARKMHTVTLGSVTWFYHGKLNKHIQYDPVVHSKMHTWRKYLCMCTRSRIQFYSSCVTNILIKLKTIQKPINTTMDKYVAENTFTQWNTTQWENEWITVVDINTDNLSNNTDEKKT